jgi:thiamine biosynthesis lipoprotein ApbE
MSRADRVIGWSTALAVLGVAAVAAVASYEHAYVLVRTHGESGWTARMVPLTVDGLI